MSSGFFFSSISNRSIIKQLASNLISWCARFEKILCVCMYIYVSGYTYTWFYSSSIQRRHNAYSLYMQSSIHAASCRPFLPGFRRDNHHLSSIYTFSAFVCMFLTPSPFYSSKLMVSFPKSCDMQPVIHHTCDSSPKVSLYIYMPWSLNSYP